MSSLSRLQLDLYLTIPGLLSNWTQRFRISLRPKAHDRSALINSFGLAA